MGISPQAMDRAALEQRRAQAGVEGDSVWGLALSGGGIRSATFCFGLLRGLARASSLRRFDYLSTVSGGGYVGAAFGRLFQGRNTPQHIEERLAGEDTLLLWWLRNNGRYLTPAGARDLGQALASVVRNTLFSHAEAGVLMLLLAGVMLLPYVVMVLCGFGPAGVAASTIEWPVDAWKTFGSAWWYLAVIPLAFALHWIFAYWFARDGAAARNRLFEWGGAFLSGVVALLLVYFGVWLPRHSSSAAALWIHGAVALVLLTPLTARLFHRGDTSATADRGKIRLAHTKRLAVALWCIAVCGVLGLVDWTAAALAALTLNKALRAAPTITLGTLAGAVTLARMLLPRVQRWLASSTFKRVNPEALVQLAGLMLLFGVVLFWAVAFDLMLSPLLAWSWWPANVLSDASVLRWAVVMAGCVLYVSVSAKDVESLNLSSLHNFYRARIERAYVSTGNWRSDVNPKGRFPEDSPLTKASRQVISQVARLVESVDGDDVLLREYAPHRHGGPIHLITCSINQTVDDRTGMYNADRMGVALTVSSLGVETGTGAPVPFEELDLDPTAGSSDAQVGQLSRWVAVSGAAASSGMGSQTSVGFAALMFLSGLRLGYWTPRLLRKPAAGEAGKKAAPAQRADNAFFRWLARTFLKQSLLLAELLARFPGLGSASWYVSDGGHFENTAVYPLLKRKLGLIVLADCGADPDYRFEDVENLVRKARIDYGASIEFLRPDQFAANDSLTGSLLSHVGTLTAGEKHRQESRQPGPQGVLLARIRYFDAAPGLLVIVKPRVYADVPLEVSGYAARNAAFPQEPTSDQFFAEEQWEAYHQLGRFAGEWLTLPALEALRGELSNIASNPMH